MELANPTDLQIYIEILKGYVCYIVRETTAKGSLIELYIDGVKYVNGETGASLYGSGDYGMAAVCKYIAGGIVPGSSHEFTFRTYRTTDVATSDWVEIKKSFTVPMDTPVSCLTATTETKPHGKSH